MHAIDLRNEASAAARRLGYEVREDWFDGAGGGVCQLRGRKLLLLDLAQTADEQLTTLLDALAREPEADRPALSDALARELARSGS